MKYYIVTFGCAANVADSERIAGYYKSLGFTKAASFKSADHVIINTCMVRQSAEDRIYGLLHKLSEIKKSGRNLKIIVTGCMTGMMVRDKTGKLQRIWRRRMKQVDDFLPIEEIGFEIKPQRPKSDHAYVPVSNGCNNFCTFCVVPFSRGREISRPYEEIMSEIHSLVAEGIGHITLLGQNVNSYGADLLLGADNIQVMRDLPERNYFGNKLKIKNEPIRHPSASLRSGAQGKNLKISIKNLKLIGNFTPTYVKHLGRLRIPTLFPQLLADLCQIEGLEKIDFLSSNPWDFSDDLIKVIAQNPKISRNLHIAVQSGDDRILRKMNRWYTRGEFLDLVEKLKDHIPGVRLSTDIIVGFCGETRRQFQNTVKLCRQVKFYKAYISVYSDRPMTAAHKVYQDNVPLSEKKRRFRILEDLINKPQQKGKS